MYYIKRHWSPKLKTLFTSCVSQRPLLSLLENLNREIIVGSKYPRLQFTNTFLWYLIGMVQFCIHTNTCTEKVLININLYIRKSREDWWHLPSIVFQHLQVPRSVWMFVYRRVKHCKGKLSQVPAGYNKWNVRRVRLHYQFSWLFGQAFKSPKNRNIVMSRDTDQVRQLSRMYLYKRSQSKHQPTLCWY